MADLIFEAADVRRIVEHALAAPSHRERWVDYVDGKDIYEPVGPGVMLVHDEGIYLLSNGLPPDIVEEGRLYAAYAHGCDPRKDPDYDERSRELVGGDDFSENIDWAQEIKSALDQGANFVVFRMDEDEVSLTFSFPLTTGTVH